MKFQPVNRNRWKDLVQLFEAHGNPNYCWCMTWRMSSSEFRTCSSRKRRKALKEKVESGTPIGIISYINKKPMGWCSIAPRKTYDRLERSRSIQRIDTMNTWSITCFFIQPNYQRQNISLKLLKEAIKYACSQGAEVVEGYPVEPKNDNGKQNFKISYRFMGFISTFRQAGFKDVTPEGHKRTIMRYTCRNSQIAG